MSLLPARMQCADDFPMTLGKKVVPPTKPTLLTKEQEFERWNHAPVGAFAGVDTDTPFTVGVDRGAIGGDATSYAVYLREMAALKSLDPMTATGIAERQSYIERSLRDIREMYIPSPRPRKQKSFSERFFEEKMGRPYGSK